MGRSSLVHKLGSFQALGIVRLNRSCPEAFQSGSTKSLGITCYALTIPEGMNLDKEKYVSAFIDYKRKLNSDVVLIELSIKPRYILNDVLLFLMAEYFLEDR